MNTGKDKNVGPEIYVINYLASNEEKRLIEFENKVLKIKKMRINLFSCVMLVVLGVIFCFMSIIKEEMQKSENTTRQSTKTSFSKIKRHKFR